MITIKDLKLGKIAILIWGEQHRVEYQLVKSVDDDEKLIRVIVYSGAGEDERLGVGPVNYPTSSFRDETKTYGFHTMHIASNEEYSTITKKYIRAIFKEGITLWEE